MICYLIFMGIVIIGGIGPIIQQMKYDKNKVEREYTEKEHEMFRRQMPIWDDFDENEYKYTDTY